jgi:hypothetical protein
LRILDLWLQYIDTQDVKSLFAQVQVDYQVPQLKGLNLEIYSQEVSRIIRNRDVSKISLLSSMQDVKTCLQLLQSCNERVLLRDAYAQLLGIDPTDHSVLDRNGLIDYLLRFLPDAPYVVDLFFSSKAWESQKTRLLPILNIVAVTIVEKLVLIANTMRYCVRLPLRTVLQELDRMSVQALASIVELVSLSIRDAETALDILLEVIEPETGRLLTGEPIAITQNVKGLIGIALEHIEEAASSRKLVKEPLQLTRDGKSDNSALLRANIRIDSPLNELLRKDDHVILTVSDPPTNSPFSKPFSMDAVVTGSELGEARFRCLHEPPLYYGQCFWNLTHCGSFVTTKAMFSALTTLYTERAQCCHIFHALIGVQSDIKSGPTNSRTPILAYGSLNQSQNQALKAVMTNPLTFLWGPPGTGKTHTTVAIIVETLKTFPK